MTDIRDHRDLRAWRTAVDLGVKCYTLSRAFPREERFGLTAQIRRAAVSVASNIAEGNGRITRGEYLNQLSAARGSLREVDTQLEFALRLDFAPLDEILDVRTLVDVDAGLVTNLIRSLQKTGNRR